MHHQTRENRIHKQKVFLDQFNNQSIWWLIGCLVLGLLVGLWLSVKVALNPQASSSSVSTSPLQRQPERVKMTRLMALLSYGKLRGQGIQLKDILLIGSRIDIDTH